MRRIPIVNASDVMDAGSISTPLFVFTLITAVAEDDIERAGCSCQNEKLK